GMEVSQSRTGVHLRSHSGAMPARTRAGCRRRQLHCREIVDTKMKTLLICHAGDRLNEVGLARWLGSFSDLVGIVIVHESNRRMWKRIRREIKRVGFLRFLA